MVARRGSIPLPGSETLILNPKFIFVLKTKKRMTVTNSLSKEKL
jgi:hypothetical protein